MPFVKPNYPNKPLLTTIHEVLGELAEVAWDRDIPGDYPWFRLHDPRKNQDVTAYCYDDCTGTELWVYSGDSGYPWDHTAMVTDGHSQAWLWNGEVWEEWISSNS
jgi:hypothetical protein